jgi:ribosomal-protein-alanine N-acetyltransferase
MLELNFDPFPILETERLVMRQITIGDANDIFDLRSNPEAMKYIGRPRPKVVADVHDLIANMNELSARIQWGVTMKGEKKVIGTIGYHVIEKQHYRAEIGYMLGIGYWKKGLMSEAIIAIVNFGFEKIGLHSIEARIDPENEQSAKILEKNAFIKEGHLKENFFYNDKFTDTGIYSMLKSKWANTQH